MQRGERVKRFRDPGADYEIRIVGDRPAPLSDFYHALVASPWRITILAISGFFLATNAVFAIIYMIVGGIAHAAAGSFRDAFFFSVQTMGTVGYGAMYPDSTAANLVVTAEAITGLTLTALATGIVFAKFSRSTARLIFSSKVVISPMNGVPTLALRIGNQRGNQIVDAQVKVTAVRTERTQEGRTFYRMVDLPLTRQNALSLSRSWNVHHVIDRASPLYGETPATLVEKEVELQILVVGLDDATMQTVHGGHRYFARDILWGHRLGDVLSETPEGHMLLDLRRFHDVEPTEPTPEFPYP